MSLAVSKPRMGDRLKARVRVRDQYQGKKEALGHVPGNSSKANLSINQFGIRHQTP